MEETILEYEFGNMPLAISEATSLSSDTHIEHPIVLSLFSGAGGLDIGFHQVGFKIAACVEIEKVFSETLRINADKHIDIDCQVINRDIRNVYPIDIVADTIDFIIGGPPCQSFSAIGRRVGGVEGALNSRGGLFEHYSHLVDYYKPKGFLFENVRGILSSHGGNDWGEIIKEFAHLGYQLSYLVLDTADYGVPQHRERVIMVGTQYGLPKFKFPKPTHGPNSPTIRKKVEKQSELQPSFFENLEVATQETQPFQYPHSKEYLYHYTSLKQRRDITDAFEAKIDRIYRFQEFYEGNKCIITVSPSDR